MIHANSKNSVKQKYAMLSKKIIASTFLISIIFPNINKAYADLDENEKGAIRVYPKSYDPDKKGIRNLIASPELKVEYLEVDSWNKKLAVIQAGKDPQEIERVLYPSSFPWQLTPEKIEDYLASQSLRLTQLDDGKYKLEMHTIGKGGFLPIIPIIWGAGPLITGVATLTAGTMIAAATVGVFQTGTNDIQQQARVRAEQAKKARAKKR